MSNEILTNSKNFKSNKLSIKKLEELGSHSDESEDDSSESSSSESKNKLIINLAYSTYPIVEQVATKHFNMKAVREPNTEWDILWSDGVCFRFINCQEYFPRKIKRFGTLSED